MMREKKLKNEPKLWFRMIQIRSDPDQKRYDSSKFELAIV